MFEYLNPGFIIMALLVIVPGSFTLIIISKNKKKETERKVIKTFMMIVSIVPIWHAYYTYQTAEDNIGYFKQNKELHCASLTSSYKVSKNDNWQLDKNYFVKDSLMIKANHCKIF